MRRFADYEGASGWVGPGAELRKWSVHLVQVARHLGALQIFVKSKTGVGDGDSHRAFMLELGLFVAHCASIRADLSGFRC